MTDGRAMKRRPPSRQRRVRCELCSADVAVTGLTRHQAGAVCMKTRMNATARARVA